MTALRATTAVPGLCVSLIVISGAALGWMGCTTSATDGGPNAAEVEAGASAEEAGSGDDGGSSVGVPGLDAALATDARDAVVASAACVTYCDTVQSVCSVDYPQFGSKAACLNACAFYPPGTATDEANAGNTLKCRQTHAMAAGSHCFHGGPYGYGGCGSMCEGFCQIVMGWCAASKTGAPFASAAACATECEGWAWAPSGPDGFAAYRPTTPTTGNTLECREVQLVMSLESSTARDTFCPLAATNSAACK